MKLQEIMIPPLMSSTMRGQDVLPGSKEGTNAQSNANKAAQQVKSAAEDKKMGRPEKENE
jgi:hypothetical protein